MTGLRPRATLSPDFEGSRHDACHPTARGLQAPHAADRAAHARPRAGRLEPADRQRFAAAAADGALAETPVLDAAGDEASDDPFHVSGAGLAIAVIIPGIFLIATGAIVAWAVSARARPEDDEGDA